MKFDYDDLKDLSIEINDEAEEKCRYIIRIKSFWSGRTWRVFSSKKMWFESEWRYQILTTKI